MLGLGEERRGVRGVDGDIVVQLGADGRIVDEKGEGYTHPW
jgi:hypothetical protein